MGCHEINTLYINVITEAFVPFSKN